jgi:hypothetical protein
MTDQGNPQIRIHSSQVRLAEREDVDLIEGANQGPDDSVGTRGFVWQAHTRPCRNLWRLGTKKGDWKRTRRGDRAVCDPANDRTLHGD